MIDSMSLTTKGMVYNMRNIIGLEYYRSYKKENELLGKEVMKARTENDAEMSLKLVHNDEKRQIIVKYFIISFIIMLLGIGLYTIILNEYNRIDLSWVDVIVFAAWGIVFIVLFRINKKKKKTIIKESQSKWDNEIEIVKQYKENQDKLFKIVIYIICINDYYSILLPLKGDDLTKKWEEITSREIEIVNKSINYNICIAAYQNYFDEWLVKQDKYE